MACPSHGAFWPGPAGGCVLAGGGVPNVHPAMPNYLREGERETQRERERGREGGREGEGV